MPKSEKTSRDTRMTITVHGYEVAMQFAEKPNIALLHALTYPRDDVHAHGLAFRLGETAEQCNQEFTGLRQGVDVFLFNHQCEQSGNEKRPSTGLP